MTVGQLADDSMHGVYLTTLGTSVNVVRDCVANYIVSLGIAQELYRQEGYPYVEIEFCPACTDDDTGEWIPCPEEEQ